MADAERPGNVNQRWWRSARQRTLVLTFATAEEAEAFDHTPNEELFTAINNLGATLHEEPDHWEGRPVRECGEHRTLGRRAWCYDCSSYCSPLAPCNGCELPDLRERAGHSGQAMALDQPAAVLTYLGEARHHLAQAHGAATEENGLTGPVRDMLFGLNTAVDSLAGMISGQHGMIGP